MEKQDCYWVYVGDELRFICDSLETCVECLLQDIDFTKESIWSPIAKSEVDVVEEFGEDWSTYFLEHPYVIEEYYDITFDRGVRYK